MQTTAKAIMQSSAALMNDAAQSLYTSIAQMPYFNMALRELQELFEENNIPVTNATSDVLLIPSGTTEIGFSGTPHLPADLIEIQAIFERPSGAETYDWLPLSRREFLPMNLVPTSQIMYFAWVGQVLKLGESNQDNDIKIDYVRSLFAPITDENTILTVINCDTFLSYRTAALCSEYIGENPSRAESLNTSAALAIARALNINVKGSQVIPTRRRPFRQSYRRGGGYGTID